MNNYNNEKGSVQALKKNTRHRLHGTSAFFVLDSVFFFFVACMRTDDDLTTS